MDMSGLYLLDSTVTRPKSQTELSVHLERCFNMHMYMILTYVSYGVFCLFLYDNDHPGNMGLFSLFVHCVLSSVMQFCYGASVMTLDMIYTIRFSAALHISVVGERQIYILTS